MGNITKLIKKIDEDYFFINGVKTRFIDETNIVNPTVSVTMITYNQEAYIEKAILGVVNQKTNFKFKLIIGEDFSNDRTRDIVIKYQKMYPNIICLKLPVENLGVTINSISNRFFCNGKYVADNEGDDYWIDEYKLQKQVSFLEANSEFTLCHSNVKLVDINDKEIVENNYKKWNSKFDVLDYKAAIFDTINFTCTTIYKNEINLKLLKLNGEGSSIWLLPLLDGKAKYFNDKTAVYRVGSGISNNTIWHKSFYNKALFLLSLLSFKRNILRNIWLLRGVLYFVLVKLSYDLNIYKLRQIARKFRYNKIYEN